MSISTRAEYKTILPLTAGLKSCSQFSPKTTPVDDIAIIGAGTAGLATFIHLVKEAKKTGKTNFTISIFEKNASAGPGLPWYPTQSSTLRVNDPNDGMIILPDDPMDFLKWLKLNASQLKERYSASLIEDLVSEKDRFSPRSIFGEYCQERLNDSIKEANQLGIKVRIETNTEMVDAKQDHNSIWRLTDINGKKYSANNLILTLGHLPSDKFTQLTGEPQYYSSPWQDLSAIPQDQPVVILGSGLTAIDGAKLLHLHHKGLINLISPSGHLPRIKGPKTDKTYQLKYLTAENLDKADLTLDKVKELFTAEFNHATDSNKTWNEIIELAKTLGNNPEKTLEDEINLVESNEVRIWQLMLLQMFFGSLPYIGFRLNETDLTTLMKDYFPLYNKWMAAMTLGNAKEILGMMKEGQLKVLPAHIQSISYDKESKQYEVRLDDNSSIKAAAVVNCTGTGHNLKLHTLLANMQKSGALEGHPLGGVHITSSFQTIANGKPLENCWAFGPCAFPKNLAAYSVEYGAIIAKQIATQLHKSLTAKDNVILTC